MQFRSVVLPLVLVAAVASAADAGNGFYRSWRDLGTTFATRFVAKVETQPGHWGPPAPGLARQDPPVWHPPVTEDRELEVRLALSAPAPLRPGELEAFALTSTHVYGQPAIAITLGEERSVWTYAGARTLYAPARPTPPTSGTLESITFVLNPQRRHPIRPPNVLAGLRAGTRGVDDPLVLEFDDAGRTDDGHAATSYTFQVVRKRNLWPDRVIASGTFRPQDAALRQQIVIEKGGPYQPSAEFLREGAVYAVGIRVVKYGQDYTVEPSDEARMEFLFHAAAGSYSRDARRRVLYGTLTKE